MCLHAINQDCLIKYWVVYCCKRKRKTPNSFDVDLIWLWPKNPSFPLNYCNINYTVHKHSYESFRHLSCHHSGYSQCVILWCKTPHVPFKYGTEISYSRPLTCPVRGDAPRRAKTGCERMKEMSYAGWSKASGYNGFTGCDSPLVKCLTISGDTSHKMQCMRRYKRVLQWPVRCFW